MDTYQSSITVGTNHLDELFHVNNVVYVEWVQEIARKHWETKATKSILERYFWVLTSHCIEYKSAAFLEDTLALKTFILKHKGALSHRVVEITNKKTGGLVAKSETHWCLMDAKTKKPTRIPQEISDLFA